jgi:hypothetical protein
MGPQHKEQKNYNVNFFFFFFFFAYWPLPTKIFGPLPLSIQFSASVPGHAKNKSKNYIVMLRTIVAGDIGIDC